MVPPIYDGPGVPIARIGEQQTYVNSYTYAGYLSLWERSSLSEGEGEAKIVLNQGFNATHPHPRLRPRPLPQAGEVTDIGPKTGDIGVVSAVPITF